MKFQYDSPPSNFMFKRVGIWRIADYMWMALGNLKRCIYLNQLVSQRLYITWKVFNISNNRKSMEIRLFFRHWVRVTVLSFMVLGKFLCKVLFTFHHIFPFQHNTAYDDVIENALLHLLVWVFSRHWRAACFSIRNCTDADTSWHSFVIVFLWTLLNWRGILVFRRWKRQPLPFSCLGIILLELLSSVDGFPILHGWNLYPLVVGWYLLEKVVYCMCDIVWDHVVFKIKWPWVPQESSFYGELCSTCVAL